MGTKNELVDIFGDVSSEELDAHVNNLDDRGGQEAILPEGEYTFVVDNAEMRETQASGESYLFVALSVQGGQHHGVSKTVPFMLYAADGKRMSRARNELAALMRACQVSPRDGAGALFDRVFRAPVDVYTRKKGDRAGEQANAIQWKQAQPVTSGEKKPAAQASAATPKKRWG